MLLAQISDLHVTTPGRLLDSQFSTARRLEQAVAHLVALDPRPDAVFMTGDLVDSGETEEYARLLDLLAPLSMPVFAVPGNHDERENMRAAFGAAGYLPASGFLCYEVKVGPVRVLALDTVVPGEPGGRLCSERLAWLAARLGEDPETPVVIVQHHPPFSTGIGMMDQMLLDAESRAGLAAIVSRHAQVERILCGHVHRPIVRRFAGTIASVCPSTAHQVDLDLREHGHLAVVGEPPACGLHTWLEGAGLVSHLSFIGDHGEATVLKEASRPVHDQEGLR